MKKIISFLAIAATLCFVACNKDNGKKKEKEEDPQEEVGLKITIDGNFDDWANLKVGQYASAKNNPNSPWEAVSEIRCCADADFVYYYIRYNKASLEELENEELPIRLCINTDGEFTSGYESYFLEAYDIIIEGALGSKDGGWADFDGTLYQRVNGAWSKLLEPNNNLVSGKGAPNGTEYEIMLAREVFNNAVPADQKMGDTFYTGIRFYGPAWNELSNVPNSSIDDVENGWGHLMQVITVQ